MDQRLQRRVGAEDVVQQTFKSFFLRQQKGQFDLADRQDLLRLLVQMTLNKVRSAATRESRRRGDYRRDRSATGADADTTGDDGRLEGDLRVIALHKLEGRTNAEIAASPGLGCSERTAERKLRLIREAWGVPE